MRPPHHGLRFLFAAVPLLLAARLAAADVAYFEKHVRPLLALHCYECHGEKKQEGELRLDTWAGMARGGASGPALVAGKPDESLLLVAVGYRNEELRMPPKSKLPDAAVKALQEWIASGAAHPDANGVKVKPKYAVDLEAGRRFWSFQPPVAAPQPTVKNRAWCESPIDRFLVATLEANELSPASAADKRTLIRRATLDLLGLPPASDEVAEFLADESPQAWSRLIDRLLASPRYGERWGRHWLDVARYADSNGLDENVAHGNAWRYRDYVVAAFNHDKPFDQFAREQLAGDLLAAGTDDLIVAEAKRRELLIATGFLALGPKVLAEVDEKKMELDIVDEQIETFGRAFLGMTFGCCRCHDHKFDPIRTDDYYALAGIFKSTKVMENFKKVAKWYEHSLATPDELAAQQKHREQVAEKKTAIQQVARVAAEKAGLETKAAADLPKDVEEKLPPETKEQLKKMRAELATFEKAVPPVSSAMGALEGAVENTCVCIRGSHLSPGKTIDRGIPAVFTSTNQPLAFQTSQSGRRELAEWLVDRRHPLTARVIVNRVWRWHFGRGLVESIDNFGLLGDRPSHPELLDWLAVWLIDHQWSVKELHRLIMHSAVYQQRSNLSAADRDPQNHWLAHFPMRRLEAETLRDSLLAVSGQLNLSMGGSLLHVANRGYFFDHTSKDTTKYDAPRRSIYLPVVRNNQYDVYQLFDATDATISSGDRATSTVATQALFMLNSDLVIAAARTLAEQLVSQTADEDTRIRAAYERALNRPPASTEVLRAKRFIAQFPTATDQPLAPWTAWCHVLLASNEFVYSR